MFYVYITFLLFFANFISSQLVFIQEKLNNETFKLQCIVPENNINMPITWINKENHPILYTQYKNEEVISVKHYPWKVTNLLSKDVEPITDRRWEDFEIIKTSANNGDDFELGTDKKHFSFSVYAENNVELTFYNNQKQNFSINLNNTAFSFYEWNHLNLKFSVKNNTLIKIIMGNSTWNVADKNFGLINTITLNSKNDTFWKIHNYTFYYSTIATKKVILLHRFVHKGGSLCLKFYTAMCKNCSMYLEMSLNSENLFTEPLEFNANAKWEWKESKFYFDNKPAGLLKIYVNTYSNIDGFWAVDLRKCDSSTINIRLPSILIPKTELNNSVRCVPLTENLELGRTKIYDSLLESFCGDFQICNNSNDCRNVQKHNTNNCQRFIRSTSALCPVNMWGVNCNQKCGQCLTNCSFLDGKCDSCQKGFVGDLCIQPISPSNLTYAIVDSNVILNWIYPFYLNRMVDYFNVQFDIIDQSDKVTQNSISYSKDVFNSLSLITEFNYSVTYNVSVRAIIGNQIGLSTNLQIITPPSRAYFSSRPFINNCKSDSCFITIPKPENIYSNSKLLAILVGIIGIGNFSNNDDLILKQLLNDTGVNNFSIIELPLNDYKLSIENNNKYGFINNLLLDDTNVNVHLALINIYGGKYNVTTYLLDYKENVELTSFLMEYNFYMYLLCIGCVLLLIIILTLTRFFICRKKSGTKLPNHEYSYPVFQEDRKRLISYSSTNSDKVHSDRDSYYEIPKSYQPPTYIQPINNVNTSNTHIYESLQ